MEETYQANKKQLNSCARKVGIFMKKIVIVGGVAGGASCAARLRRLDETANIVLLEKGDYISYANCGLPYHIGDVIKSRDALLVSTPTMMKDRFRIDVRTGNEVLQIHRDVQTVTVRQKDGSTYDEPYDMLVLSTGSTPIRPNIPGMDSELIQTLWTVPDTDKIRHMAMRSGATSAAVIGGGFIGLEVAENLHALGLSTTIVEAADQVMPPIDREMAALLHEHMEEQGVALLLGNAVTSFDEAIIDGKKQIRITLANGKTLVEDFVVLSIGIRPNSKLAKDAGLEVNERGGVRVDSLLRTSDPHIYAVGDMTETVDFTTGEKTQIPLAGPANKQGRIAANNLADASKHYEGTQGTSIAKVFGLAVGATGKSEKSLIAAGKKKGVDYDSVILTQNHHAGYYPGAQPLLLKVLFTPDGQKILGAQIIGAEGVDKRIDVISTAARLGAKATDLAKLELSYAPPFSSAKDPVNMAGFVIQNRLDGLVQFAEWDVLESGEEVQVLDVREDAERLAFEIPSAIPMPLGVVRKRLTELDPHKPIVVFCAIGVRAYSGARILMQNGFSDVRVYPAGVRFYRSTHYQELGKDTAPAFPLKKDLKAADKINLRLDCSGMQCPGPILKVYEGMQNLSDGELLEVRASDPGFTKDVDAWCKRTGNQLISTQKDGFDYVARICKHSACDLPNTQTASTQKADGKTLIVFSGDLDKVMASFIIANGAAAMGKKVTMFFTFWGLTALRRPDKQRLKKTAMEKMFGAMLPKGVQKLKISKMNMGGMGTLMMKKIMKDKNVNTLEELIYSAMDNGVKLVACTMSMDVMGIRKEELIDGVELGGVGYYLGDAEESNVNLFI